jgi:rhodanese-related sulfurtransferase/DNA-binding transcriptional ArsR family regulator
MERSSEAKKFRSAIYEQFARIGKAVSSPRRLELLDLLSQCPRTVEELASGLNQSVANTSQHLQNLKAARLVESEKKGLYVFYKLADESVVTFFHSLRSLAEKRLTELNSAYDEFIQNKGNSDVIDTDQLLSQVEKDNVVIVDLRSKTEFNESHIPDAISIPADKLEENMGKLPAGKEIVIYCRGPYCAMGIEAVSFLKEKGYRVKRLIQGVPEWKALGFETEKNTNQEG